jgi:predicted esterase
VPNIATCGAFVVIIDRAGWFKGIEQWGENVLGVTQKLAQNPSIDAGRIYLFGASAETAYMSNVLTNSAGLWKGAIFLNPTGLPDFSKSPNPLSVQPRPRILISAGAEERPEQFFKQYQTAALDSGVLVEYVIHPGESHHLIGNAAQFERSKAIMHLIFEE